MRVPVRSGVNGLIVASGPRSNGRDRDGRKTDQRPSAVVRGLILFSCGTLGIHETGIIFQMDSTALKSLMKNEKIHFFASEERPRLFSVYNSFHVARRCFSHPVYRAQEESDRAEAARRGSRSETADGRPLIRFHRL